MTDTIKTVPELQAAAKALWKAQQAVKKAEAKLRPLKEAAAFIEQELLDAMLASKLESVATKEATISLKRTTFAELYDDKAFFEYVKRKAAWDLVRKQPAIAACRARWEDNLDIPGVRPGTRTDLSITARSK
jgi:type II secretory pathway component GspD/PulD (secretin)